MAPYAIETPNMFGFDIFILNEDREIFNKDIDALKDYMKLL